MFFVQISHELQSVEMNAPVDIAFLLKGVSKQDFVKQLIY